MKNIKYGFLFFALFFANSCSKSFLDTNSPDGANVSAFYTTPDELNVGLTACYNNLSAQFDRLYGLGIDAIGLYCGDECESGRTLPRDFTPFENNLQTGNAQLPLLGRSVTEAYIEAIYFWRK